VFETKDSGERMEFSSGMKRDTEAGKPRFDLLWPKGIPFEEQMLTRFAALMARGAEKYDARNWEKADSEAELDRYHSSAARHFAQWASGERDEDHAAAVMFNLMCAETLRWKLAHEGEAAALRRAAGYAQATVITTDHRGTSVTMSDGRVLFWNDRTNEWSPYATGGYVR
jgi:hypothetical protein